jgi:glycosyltransferase involved in cell wall biosynthesis
LLSERERLQALEAATIVVVPSPLKACRCWRSKRWRSARRCCATRARRARRALHEEQRGLFYQDRDEFVECTKLLLADDRLRDRMGRNGKEYVKKNYRWDVIMQKYDKLIGALRR